MFPNGRVTFTMDQYDTKGNSGAQVQFGDLGLDLDQTGIAIATTVVAGHRMPIYPYVRSFFSKALDETVILRDIPGSNQWEIEGESVQIDRINWTPASAVGGLSDVTETTPQATPAFEARTLVPTPIELMTSVSREFLLENIERTGFMQTLQTETARQFGNDLELACLIGDTSGSAGATYNNIDIQFDGWRELCGTGGVYDHACGDVNPDLFWGVLAALPADRYAAGLSGYNFYVPVTIHRTIRQHLEAHRAPYVGAFYWENRQLYFDNIPVKPHSMLPTTLAGVSAQSGHTTADLSYILLMDPSNLIVGWNPRLYIHKGLRQSDGKLVYLAFYCQVGVNCINPEWLACGVNTTSVAATVSI